MKSSVLRFYLSFSGLLLLFYLAFASCYALLSPWVGKVAHFDEQQTGTIFTIIAAIALFSAPLFGILQDHLGTSKKLLMWLGAGLILCSPIMGHLFVFVAQYSFIASSVLLALYLGTVLVGGVGAVESYCERASRHIGFEYGNARLWGSLGYALAASSSGFFLRLNPQIACYITSAAGVLFVLILLSLDTRQLQPDQERRYAERTNSLKQSLGLFAIPRFWFLTLFLFAASGGFMLFDQQFPTFFSNLFSVKSDGEQVVGVLLAVQLCCDATALLVMPWFINRIGARNGLLLAGFIMACRIFLSGFITAIFPAADQSALRISMAGTLKLLQAIDVPMLIVSTFKYIAPSFDSRYTSTVYLVSFQCSQQVCAALLSWPMGYCYKAFGFEATYLVMGIFIACMTVQAIFTLPRIASSQQKGAAARA